MRLRLLLVEPEMEEIRFLDEVLSDIEGGLHFRTWVHLETLHAATWMDAEAILAIEKIDLVLLNPDLPDCQGFETFRRSKVVAPTVPVVLLLKEGEEALGVRIVREGAQDFLIRGQVDCAPLAHALRNSLERERLVAAEQTSRFIDPLTGLANQVCFDMFAERDRKLAERLRIRWMILLTELDGLEGPVEIYGEQRRDLAVVQTAELLRNAINPADVLYRISPTRFALTVFETPDGSLEWTRNVVERALTENRVLVGSAIFSPARPESLEDLLNDAADSMALAQCRHRAAGTT